MLKKSTRTSILITSALMVLSGIIYFASSYTESADAQGSVSSQIQTMFFATAGIVYIPLGIWMLKNKLHSRAPYVISILISIFLLVLYIASRNINLPIVGMQTDVGAIDLVTKVIQVGIVATSVILLRDIKKEQILSISKVSSKKDM
ncbi:MAG: hypothetical protein ACYC6W_03735 [Nitrosotalea sp.]